MAGPYTEADDIAERLIDEFLITTPGPDWAAVHDMAEKLRDIAAAELRNNRREED